MTTSKILLGLLLIYGLFDNIDNQQVSTTALWSIGVIGFGLFFWAISDITKER